MITFEIDDKQQKKLKEWIDNGHNAPVGTIGGRLEYCFAPTSLGLVIKIKDTVNGQEIDLTRYEDW